MLKFARGAGITFLTAMQCRFPFLEKMHLFRGTELDGIFMYSNLIVREKKS